MLNRFLIACREAWETIDLTVDMIRKGGEKGMAMVYVTLITKGAKTFDEVPALLKPQVENYLIELEWPGFVAVG